MIPDPSCPDSGPTNSGPKTPSSVRALVWTPTTTYESKWLENYPVQRTEILLNLSHETDYTVPAHETRYPGEGEEAMGFSIVSVSPRSPNAYGSSELLLNPKIEEIDRNMKLKIDVNGFQCGIWTLTIRARNAGGYADVNDTIEMAYR